jgi:hypothetical protein
MGIAQEIEKVRTEFVSGEELLKAVCTQEGVSELQASSWFLRNIEKLNRCDMVAFNRGVDNFRVIEHPWASDVFFDVAGHRPDLDGQLHVTWDENEDGYVGGWLSSQLEQFFGTTNVPFPHSVIDGARLRPRSSDVNADRKASTEDEVRSQVAPVEDGLATKERTTLLCIIAALAHEARIDLVRPSKAATAVVSTATGLGLQLGQRTVEEWLKRVPEAMNRRSI